MNTPSPVAAAPLIVTGLSGAGMTSALKALEDMGYEVFDNFPMTLVDALVADTKSDGMPVAIGIDTRSRGFDPDGLLKHAAKLKARILFLVCDEGVLQKRFTETRRRHPVAKDRPVSAGIKREQEWLHPLRAQADFVIDTTDLSIHDLRHALERQFRPGHRGHLTVTLMSFGFRFGVPRDADLVVDVRFLSNPHWVKELRPQTGLDEPVGAYVSADPHFAGFIDSFKGMAGPLLPRYAYEGKHYLTIAVGCTGGRHRSVYTIEQLAPWVRDKGYTVNVLHRDLDRS